MVALEFFFYKGGQESRRVTKAHKEMSKDEHATKRSLTQQPFTKTTPFHNFQILNNLSTHTHMMLQPADS